MKDLKEKELFEVLNIAAGNKKPEEDWDEYERFLDGEEV